MEFNFTPDQSLHAVQVAMKLWRRRCFLPKGVGFGNTLQHLPEDVFGALYRLNDALVLYYTDSAKNMRANLLEEERKLGINPPHLNDGQQIADCNLYSSGLDIVAIVPLQSMWSDMPTHKDLIAMAEEVVDTKHPKEHRDHVAPADIKNYYETIKNYLFRAQTEADQVETDSPDKVLVIFETRFEPASSRNDFMHGRLEGMVTFPHLASYLLFKQALSGNQLSQKGYTIFTGSRYGHISLDQTSGRPIIVPDTKYGYECKIAFATIL